MSRYDLTAFEWRVTTRLLHDGDELVAEYDGAGALLRRYVHGAGADDPLIWYEGAGLASPRWLHASPQGSIVAVTDAAGGVLARNAYDEYGIPAAANLGRFQYTGQAWLAELGLYHYKARLYSPTLGRFLQTDPIGYRDQVNLYAYVGDDPVNRSDPSGMAGANTCSMAGASSCAGSYKGDGTEAAAAPSRKDGHVGMNGLPQDGAAPANMFVDGESMATVQDAMDQRAVVSQTMSLSELAGRREARAEGILTGLTALEGAMAVRSAIAASKAAVSAVKNILGPSGPIIGRTRLGGSSLFGINSGSNLRFDWGWKGTIQTGSNVLRISGDWVRAAGVKSGHIDLLTLPSSYFD